MKVWDSNLFIALQMAITQREAWENRRGYTVGSGLLRGWKEMQGALIRGEKIEILYDRNDRDHKFSPTEKPVDTSRSKA